MVNPSTVVSIDLGAESGRIYTMSFDGARISSEERYRFSNAPVEVQGTLHWDLLAIWREVLKGISLCKPSKPVSMGVDTWGLDFALLDRAGNLLRNPVHYRDSRTEGMMEVAWKTLSREEIFLTTGIQSLSINSLYQLLSLVEDDDPILETARTFLTIPDLLNYWFTGEIACEFTNATTTQCLNPFVSDWAWEMLANLGIPTSIFPKVVPPGTEIGKYDGMQVIAPACHDTGSAVAAIPAQTPKYAYISSGTWSLVGMEISEVIVSAKALAANLTNEGGVADTYRLLKNIMGLWLLQQCRAVWTSGDRSYGYDELTERARRAKPFVALIDPDNPTFLPPGDMPARIIDYCQQSNQEIPKDVGEICRCILESLALKYRYTLELLTEVSDQPIDVLHIVGGGSRNDLLCQMVADATRIPVITGPVEASAIGNALMQWICSGEMASITEAREVVGNSFLLREYSPDESGVWDEVYPQFKTHVHSS